MARGWLSANPMKKVPRKRVINQEKFRLISEEEFFKLLAACPDQEWRTIIALARIGGLRCPSELQQLRWSDIKWDQDRFIVRSPKTERHVGHSERAVPLFHTLQRELQRLFEQVNPNDDFVIQSFQGKERWALTRPFAKISQTAGLGKIAQPFLNLRRSRSNEVMRMFGETKESLWIGHSKKVMKDHYFCATDEDYAQAAGRSLENPMPLQNSMQ
jgi:integrase